MTMNRREFGKMTAGGAAGALAIAFGGESLLMTEGCSSQATLAALVGTLGAASASLASLEGNSALAAKLQADTTAAVSAITNWVSGTTAQMVLEVIGILTSDLNLIPDIAPYSTIVALALATLQTIIAIITSKAPVVPPAALKDAKVEAQITYRAGEWHGKMPAHRNLNSAWFKGQWNAEAATDPRLAKAVIQ